MCENFKGKISRDFQRLNVFFLINILTLIAVSTICFSNTFILQRCRRNFLAYKLESFD